MVNRLQQSSSRFPGLSEAVTKDSVRVCPLLRVGFFRHPAPEDDTGGLPVFGGSVPKSGQKDGGLF